MHSKICALELKNEKWQQCTQNANKILMEEEKKHQDFLDQLKVSTTLSPSLSISSFNVLFQSLLQEKRILEDELQDEPSGKRPKYNSTE